MTREEEINEAVNTYMNGLFEDGVEIPIEDFENIEEGFIAGAQWADNHLINVWHDASEEPTIEQTHILATNETDIIEVFHLSEGRKYNFNGYLTDWSRVVVSFNLTKWAYISDLLPKGGEE